jgi:hypothetical protein
MEDLAHNEVADIIARLSEMDEESSAKHTPGDTKDCRPVVSAVPAEETRWQVRKRLRIIYRNNETHSPMKGARIVEVTEKAFKVYPAVAILRP